MVGQSTNTRDGKRGAQPLLELCDLSVEFGTTQGSFCAVDQVSFSVYPGQSVGIVGESGVGKTAVALSILSLLPDPPARIAGGRVLFKGEDLLGMDEQRLRRIRGTEIAMVFQEPGNALNPVMTVGSQVAEVLRVHRGERPQAAKERVVELFRLVGIASPEQRYQCYPHQLSGGMQQRVMLAMALICEPSLLIADEPTSALDVTIQAQVIAMLGQLQRRREMSLLLVTHDLGLVAEICHRMVVMYGGQVVESTSVKEGLTTPAHPYTAALLHTLRSLEQIGTPLAEIPKRAADPWQRTGGCRFADRCTRVEEDCRLAVPSLRPLSEDCWVRCLHPLWNPDGDAP